MEYDNKCLNGTGQVTNGYAIDINPYVCNETGSHSLNPNGCTINISPYTECSSNRDLCLYIDELIKKYIKDLINEFSESVTIDSTEFDDEGNAHFIYKSESTPNNYFKSMQRYKSLIDNIVYGANAILGSKFLYKIIDIKVIVPDKVFEFTFNDGTKEKTVCDDSDTFSLEAAITIALCKKCMGGTSKYNKAVRNAIKLYEKKIKEEELAKEEQERREKKRAKRKERKKRRVAKKREEEKERQIEIQAEAYIRAMNHMKGL